jgi:hypothetical protein
MSDAFLIISLFFHFRTSKFFHFYLFLLAGAARRQHGTKPHWQSRHVKDGK